MPPQQEQGIGAFASKYQPQPFEGEDDKWREWARVFRSWSGRFFGGALAEIYEHVEGHRNDSASILHLALTSLRFDAGLLRNISTELYHVLIMLTRGRAQRLVLNAAEPEELEAYRFLLRRYEPVVTITTVSKLVDMLATRFSGDLVDSLTDFERRVTSWEHDAKETLPDLIKIGVAIKGLEKGCLRGHVLINTAGTPEWTKFVKEIENVKLARRNTQLVPMDLSAMGSQDSKFRGNCSWCGTYGHMARDCRKKTEYMQTTKRVGWSGTDDKTKGKPGKGKGKQDKGKGKGMPSEGKGKSKGKGKGKQHGKKGKKGFHELEEHEDKQETQTRQEYAERTTLTTGLTQTCGRVTGAQICGKTLHGSKLQDSCHRRNRLRNSPIQTPSHPWRPRTPRVLGSSEPTPEEHPLV